MATRLQDKKADLLERVVDRLHDQLAEGQAERAEAFLRHYYRAVLAGRSARARPARPLRRGAVPSPARRPARRRPGDGPGLQPAGRAARLAVDPHRGRGGHRRHAVPGRFDEHGAQPAGPPDPHHHPPGGAGQARRRRHARGGAGIRRRRRRRRRASNPSCISRSTGRAIPSGSRRSAPISSGCWPTSAPRSRTGGRCSPRSTTAIADLRRGAKVLEATELAEAEAFLRWIADNHFTLLGYGCYDLIRDRSGDQLQRVEGSALGLLRRQATGSKISRSFASLPPELRRQAREPAPLVITKANARSTVHRPVYLDYIGVRRFDAKGKVEGEHRFLGLFTSAAYNRNPRDIPLLRHKVSRMIERAQLAPTSHSGKALANILETYPRDELFQTADDELFETVQEILHLHERQTHPPVPAPRRLRPLRLLPGLRAARALQHRAPAPLPGHPAGGAERHRGRVPGPGVGIGRSPASSSSSAPPTASRTASSAARSRRAWSRRRAPGATCCATA